VRLGLPTRSAFTRRGEKQSVELGRPDAKTKGRKEGVGVWFDARPGGGVWRGLAALHHVEEESAGSVSGKGVDAVEVVAGQKKTESGVARMGHT
jgi:hypothetical protein